MGRDEETNTNKQETKQTNKQTKLQVQEQYNFSLSLSSFVTPSASSPDFGV
jgi:hypothetical protein